MKKTLIFIFSFILVFSTVLPVFAADDEGVKTYGEYYDIEAPAYETEIALLVNADTDKVIFSKNADRITAPASLAKIVTALVVLDECNDLQRQITCSYDAIHSLDGTGSSIAGLIPDEIVSLEMLLYCLFLPSANDAAAVLAEEFGNGKTEDFVKKMNDYVAALGCKDTYFANAHGLDDESVEGYYGENQNRTTANDMYLISKKALANDTIVKISSKYGKTMPATNKSDIRYLYSTNQLLNDYSDYYYEGAVGLKTGTTDKAGACLISSATKDGYTYISIAMQGTKEYIPEGESEMYNSAYLMCRYMLRWAFNNIEMKILADDNYVMSEVGVKFGRGADYVGLVPQKPVSAVVHEDLNISDLRVELADDFPTQVDSPIEKGALVGKAKLMYKDVEVAEMDLVAYKTVKKNYLWAAVSWMEGIVTSKAFLPVVITLVVIAVIFFISTRKQRRIKKRKKNSVDVVSLDKYARK